ncbi:MAG: single-stranded-DNA-specific exonuclease RecJ [Candidatus Moranbacteria bacterium]|nr:single-stranded-DNA-specific exonuclease RecJ [Candidatus Moranbacteria bacterium]
MVKWKLKEKVNIDSAGTIDLHPVALQLLFQRGIDTLEGINRFVFPDYERDILDPFLFSQMKKAVERVQQAKENGKPVAIFGDYDADGITSVIILEEVLNDLGINPIVYIPDKKSEGYGMNERAVEELARRKVKLIITVDCGITNINEVEKANQKGIDVIIIDHHHVPANLPGALAIINPRLSDSSYPFRELAGVGVAFKVAQALYQMLLPGKIEQTKWMLDLVAIGTVADCVPLVGENRTVVKYGLIVLSKTRRMGLRELFAVGRIAVDESNPPDTRKISFQIAPRINAAGRMDHANVAYHLLIEKDQVKARTRALEIEATNQKRQQVTDRVAEEVRILANTIFKDKKLIFAVGEHFPIGVAGLVAGKIAEEFNKPTAVLQKGEKESTGSFRSIPQINIIETIESLGRWLLKYGGHSQAAGITVTNKNLEKFYEGLNKLIEKELEGKEISPEVEIDAEITPADVDFELAETLEKFAPFGEGNPEPVFLMKNLTVDKLKTVGNGNQHLKVYLRSTDGPPKIFEAIGFNLNEQFGHLKENDVIDVLFNLQLDNWNGNKKIQLKLIDLRPAINK